jgi:hypothetical protein
MFLLLFMAVSFLFFFLQENSISKNSRLRRDTFREKGYRKDQYMRCKVKNSVSITII